MVQSLAKFYIFYRSLDLASFLSVIIADAFVSSCFTDPFSFVPLPKPRKTSVGLSTMNSLFFETFALPNILT